jgi:hypothetical protein
VLKAAHVILLALLINSSLGVAGIVDPVIETPVDPDCPLEEIVTGPCGRINATVDDDQAVLEISQPGGVSDEQADQPANASPSNDKPKPTPTPTTSPRETVVDNMGGLGQQMIVGDLANATIERGPWEMIYVTLEDIARFRPNAGIAKMEPNGWAIRGVPANFWIETTAQILEGELLDAPASVRFTPLRYRWDYGDGERVARSVAGGSWVTLGVDEFAETPASHAFARSGVHVVQPSVDFTVEYQFGPGEWIPIDGVVRAQASPLTVVVTGAATVLVANDCVTAPRGPGC